MIRRVQGFVAAAVRLDAGVFHNNNVMPIQLKSLREWTALFKWLYSVRRAFRRVFVEIKSLKLRVFIQTYVFVNVILETCSLASYLKQTKKRTRWIECGRL